MVNYLETIKTLETKAKELDNLTLRDICANVETNNGNKGQLGQLVEVYHYGKKLDSKSEPDLNLMDGNKVELKVVPVYKLKRGGYSAKERLILQKINYFDIVNKSFEEIFEKIKIMLIHFYLYESDKDKLDYIFLKSIIHHFFEEDRDIIEQDFNIIKNKVINGQAHTLSDSDTSILAPTTKGQGRGKDFVGQPFSAELAKHRAFTLKQSYVTYLFNKNNYIPLNIKENPFLYLETKLKPYIGKTIKELSILYSIEIKSKQQNAQVISSVLGIKKNSLNSIAEFAKLDYHFHTINLEANGNLKESLSLCTINFNEIYKQGWEESEIYNLLSSRTFIFVIFRKNENSTTLEKVVKYKFSQENLETYKKIWDKTQIILEEGVKLVVTLKGTKNNLPGMKDNEIGHIRSKSSIAYNPNKKSPFDILPNGDKITKQAFWINNSFILSLLHF